MIRGKYEVYSGRSHLSADRQGRQAILFPKAIDDYIPARRPCLLRGKGEISWNFACKVDKKATFHTA